MSTASVWNVPREARNILKRFRKKEPSLTVELYPNHFRFQHQSGIFLYDSPMSAFLDAVKAQQIPAQLLPTLSTVRINGQPIPFYDGCLIVELVDLRASVAQLAVNGGEGEDSKPTPVRVILRPTPESNWVDLQLLNDEVSKGRWDDGDLLEVEARILASTGPPLHIGTSLYALRVANEACSSSSSIAGPSSQPSHRHRTRTYNDNGDSSTFSLLRTGAPSTSSFRANFSRMQNIESFRQRVAVDASLKNPDPFKSRLAPPPSRVDASPEKTELGGQSSNVYESRPNSPQGKAAAKRRASTTAPGEEEKKPPAKKKKKNKGQAATVADNESVAGDSNAGSPEKSATPASTAAGLKPKKPTGKKNKKNDEAESTAAPTPAASEIDDSKPTTNKKGAAAGKKKKGSTAPTPTTAVANLPSVATASTNMSPPHEMSRKPSMASSLGASPVVSHLGLANPGIAPPPILIPRAGPAIPQSFTNHLQKTQQPFQLSLPTGLNNQGGGGGGGGGGGTVPSYPSHLSNGLPTQANIQAMQQSLAAMQQQQQQQQQQMGNVNGRPMSQESQIALLQAQLNRTAQAQAQAAQLQQAQQAALHGFGGQGGWNGGQ